jgi:hypothetical protein
MIHTQQVAADLSMEALALRSPLQVTELNDRSSFVALADEWDALVASTRDQIFFRHEFLRIWIDNFAPGDRLRVLLARSPDGKLIAGLPLIEQRTTLYGVPVRQLVSAANPHSCRFDFIAADPQSAAVAFFD